RRVVSIHYVTSSLKTPRSTATRRSTTPRHPRRDISSVVGSRAMTRQTPLKSRPSGIPTAANFEAADAPIPSPAEGGVLRKTLYLSLDPYMRGRMSDAPSYAAPVNVGDVMCGHTVSEVVESRDPAFHPGDIVAAYDGWQQY